MPDLSDPHIVAQLVPLGAPAFAPGRTARPHEMAAERRWEALVDAGLIGATPPLSPERRAEIDAMERVLGVGRYHGR